MTETPVSQSLGTVLQQAGLVTAAQIEVAQRDQVEHDDLQLGEILILRGWLKQETVDFFMTQWPQLVNRKQDHPLGHYFVKAGLLSQEQVDALLREQWQTGLRFGALAVLRGWLRQETVDFFLEYLAPEFKADSPFMGKRVSSTTTSGDSASLDTVQSDSTYVQDNEYWDDAPTQFEEEIDPDDVTWIG